MHVSVLRRGEVEQSKYPVVVSVSLSKNSVFKNYSLLEIVENFYLFNFLETKPSNWLSD